MAININKEHFKQNHIYDKNEITGYTSAEWKATAQGTAVNGQYKGRTYTVYEKTVHHHGLWKLAKGIAAFLATILTVGFGLISPNVRSLWQQAVSGDESIHLKVLTEKTKAPQAPVLSAKDQQLVDFYGGAGKDTENRTLQDIWEFSLATKESAHDYIQWLFPSKTKSQYNPSAPVLNAGTIKAMRESPIIMAHLAKSLDHMLVFYGLRFDAQRQAIEVGPDFQERALVWLNPGNHNYLRLTRILNCLNIFGLKNESRAFFDCLQKIYSANTNRVDESAFKMWASTQK